MQITTNSFLDFNRDNRVHYGFAWIISVNGRGICLETIFKNNSVFLSFIYDPITQR